MFVQSFSRSVVQSFSRSVVSWRTAVTFAALTGTLGLGASAHPSDAAPQTNKHPQEFAEFDTSEPGVLIIDGSSNRTFLPLREESRSFASEEEYFAFIRSVLNFEGDDAKSLTAFQLGQLYSYSSDLQSIIPVTDPIATAIGGRHGMVIVDGTHHCIDRDRCSAPVSPFTLRSPDDYWKDGGVVSDASTSSLPGQTVQQTANRSGTSQFSIEWELSHRITTTGRDLKEGNYQLAETIARTRQLQGGFQIVNGGWTAPTLACDFRILQKDLPGCHHVPSQLLIFESTGTNELFVRSRKLDGILDIHGNCVEWSDAETRQTTDVPMLEVRQFAEGWTTNFSPDVRFGLYPYWIFSTHRGRDPSSQSRRWTTAFGELRVNPSPDCIP